MPGARMRFVELPGREPARVYLHGLGSSSPAYFARVAVHPALSGHRSLLLDLLGFGLSDRPRAFSYTLEAHAGAVAAALDHLQLRGVHLVGHSMGGAIAIVLAARRPELVSRLVVVEPNLDPTERRRLSGYDEESFVGSGYEKALEAVGSEWRATMRLADPRALFRTERSLGQGTEPMMRAILQRLALPRTLIRGEQGEPLNGKEELEASGVQVVVIPRAEHNVMLDNPDGFAEAAAEALRTGAGLSSPGRGRA